MTTAQTHVDPFAQPEANLVLAHWMTLLAWRR